jgi:hypothetical protein
VREKIFKVLIWSFGRQEKSKKLAAYQYCYPAAGRDAAEKGSRVTWTSADDRVERKDN